MQLPVACTEDVLEVMELGARNRAVAETKMNERSSRSHSVLTVMVDGVSKLDGSRFHGCLHLIDLAGNLSFRCRQTLVRAACWSHHHFPQEPLSGIVTRGRSSCPTAVPSSCWQDITFTSSCKVQSRL